MIYFFPENFNDYIFHWEIDNIMNVLDCAKKIFPYDLI